MREANLAAQQEVGSQGEKLWESLYVVKGKIRQKLHI
jgi:hypothetical protein